MIKLIILSTLLNTSDSNIYATPPENPIDKTYVSRRKGKGNRGRRRGGSGLR